MRIQKELHFVWLKLKIETKMRKGKYVSKIKIERSIKFFLSLNWIYYTDEEYVLLKILENNHKCVPFGFFITNINLLSLLIFFISLAVFGFILNKLPFKWYKVPTMLLENVSINTEILFVHCYKFCFYYCLFFFCVCWKLLKIVYLYCLKV